MQVSSELLSHEELDLFQKGQLHHAYRIFGAHLLQIDGESGVRFALWAPNARHVSVVGDFNGWNPEASALQRIGETGVWAAFIPGVREGDRYKYAIVREDGGLVHKADPFAFCSELRPHTASVVTAPDDYHWDDRRWMERRAQSPPYSRPMLIYEVHLSSWRMDAPEQFRSYEQLADELVAYVKSMGYTHVELMPVTEHPLDQSWGYQTTGYFAATSRYGHPIGLKKLIDRCHQEGIGVVLDWVPGHFCKDDHGLRLFDGTPLYEDANPLRAEKPLWGTLAFDYGKPQVQSFLISSALFWFDVYHIDGLRVDAVASMIDLHLDKPDAMKTYNRYGGTENVEALHFLRKLNETVFREYPNALMIAEDSSSYPGVTSPVSTGGLGFNYKWNMGWMNDVLCYMQHDPAQRPSHHSLLTFSLLYAFSENYVLPLSHDEVVHGKRSLLNKMPGTYEEKFANLRLLYGYWMTHPGKKLLFMGGEFGQFDEWKDYTGLDWDVLKYPLHDSMREFVKALNFSYTSHPELWEKDHAADGFEWIDVNNAEQCVLSFLRKGTRDSAMIVVVCNFSRTSYPQYRIGVPLPGKYRLLLSSDDAAYGGSGTTLPAVAAAEEVPMHGKSCSLHVPVPALTFQMWKKE